MVWRYSQWQKIKSVYSRRIIGSDFPANLLLTTAKGEKRLMNYESLSDGGFATGSMMGSGGFIVLDEDQCVVKNTYTLARFYRHESCGQCSPCREGTGWMEKILLNIEKGKGKISDIDLLWDIQRKIEGNTICPLGECSGLAGCRSNKAF